eukprot:Selendium_serpulae@DN2861_c0_g1_i1.p1
MMEIVCAISEFLSARGCDKAIKALEKECTELASCEETKGLDLAQATKLLGSKSPLAPENIGTAVHQYLIGAGHTKTAKKFAKQNPLEASSEEVYDLGLTFKKILKKLAKKGIEPPTSSRRKRKLEVEEAAKSTEEDSNTKTKLADEETDGRNEDGSSCVKRLKKSEGAHENVEDKQQLTEPDNEETANCSENDGTANGRKRKHTGTRFQRIDNERWLSKVAGNAALEDNSYAAFGANSHAAEAANILQQVKGKNFRQEKNKKKRATQYGKGGIEVRVNSFKFDSDSD